MKISFFDDEPEIFPLQYGGKARTIVNLASELIKLKEVEEVTILSKSIISEKREFIKNNIRYVVLNDENLIELLTKEIQRVDILNIHCCSFTFPMITGKAKKIYFLHDVLIATAEKGSHLDKALGGDFDAIVAPSDFAKNIYEKYRKIINGKVSSYVIPRNINEQMFEEVSKEEALNQIENTKILAKILKCYKYIMFFPSRPIEEKGYKYLCDLMEVLNDNTKKFCVIGPFNGLNNMHEDLIDIGWIKSENLKYYYSLVDITLNFSELPETFSQVCIESTFCGTPVVAFKTGNIERLAEELENIIIVDKNIRKIKKGIEKALIIRNNDKIKKNVKKKIIKQYSTKRIIRSYIDLYKKLYL